MFKITQEQLTQLARIYNTLAEVETKGESSFMMTDSLRALQELVNQVSRQTIEQENNNSQEG